MRYSMSPLMLVCFVLVALGPPRQSFAADSPPNLPGDFDMDRKLDADDIDALSQLVRSAEYDPVFDLNGDSILDQEDRRIWVEDIAQTYFGDTNLNGVFNTGDLVHVFQDGEYEDAFEGNSTWRTGDWDGDGDFTSSDLVLSFQSGAFEGPPRLPAPSGGPKTVPEPAGLVLLATAGLILQVVRPRR